MFAVYSSCASSPAMVVSNLTFLVVKKITRRSTGWKRSLGTVALGQLTLAQARVQTCLLKEQKY